MVAECHSLPGHRRQDRKGPLRRWVAVVYLNKPDGKLENFYRLLVEAGQACVWDFRNNEFNPRTCGTGRGTAYIEARVGRGQLGEFLVRFCKALEPFGQDLLKSFLKLLFPATMSSRTWISESRSPAACCRLTRLWLYCCWTSAWIL